MQKNFYTQNNIGKVKYTISYYDGVSTHNDGSPFYGIYTFSNKRLFEKKQRELLKEGYVENDTFSYNPS
jgi:hypothetical protein